MATIVTTSSHGRTHSRKIPLIIMAVVLGATIFIMVARTNQVKGERDTGIVNNTIATPVATSTNAKLEKGEKTDQITDQVTVVQSPKIIRPSKIGTPRDMPLSRTGNVVRAVSAGKGVIATNIVTRKESVFQNPTENFIYRYANSVKHPMMLFPKFGSDVEKDVRQILETDIVVYDDDDEETVKVKENVASIKQELLQAIAEGYNAGDILFEMREDNNRRVKNRFRMQRELNGLLSSNMIEEATEFLNEANKKMSDDFLPPLVFDESMIPERQ